MVLPEWLAFPFFKYPLKWCTYSAGMAGATWNCSHLSASPVYTIQPCHFMQSHIRKVYACLAVTCHLHFWQNDQDLLRATDIRYTILTTNIKFVIRILHLINIIKVINSQYDLSLLTISDLTHSLNPCYCHCVVNNKQDVPSSSFWTPCNHWWGRHRTDHGTAVHLHPEHNKEGPWFIV